MTMDGADAVPVDDEAARVAAVRVVGLALPLLDRAGLDVASTWLQHAIDAAGEDGTSTEEALRLFESEKPERHEI